MALSVDHSAPVPITEGDALFLSVKAGMTVIVKHLPEIGQPDQPESWWMAGADKKAPTEMLIAIKLMDFTF